MQAAVKDVLTAVAPEPQHWEVRTKQPVRRAASRELFRLLDRLVLHSPDHRSWETTNIIERLEERRVDDRSVAGSRCPHQQTFSLELIWDVEEDRVEGSLGLHV